MYKKRLVAPDTYYVGHSQRDYFLFENVYPLYNGVSYNSYIILDEKRSEERRVGKEWRQEPINLTRFHH